MSRIEKIISTLMSYEKCLLKISYHHHATVFTTSQLATEVVSVNQEPPTQQYESIKRARTDREPTNVPEKASGLICIYYVCGCMCVYI